MVVLRETQHKTSNRVLVIEVFLFINRLLTTPQLQYIYQNKLDTRKF